MRRSVRIEKNSLRDWLEELSKAKEGGKNSGLWKYAYRLAARPRRQRVIVNLDKIEKHAKPGENIIVPGKVLGTGELKKRLNIAAVEYSGGAEEKVRKAGGKVLGLQEMMKQESVRIII